MSEPNVVLTIPRPGEVKLKERPHPKIVPGFALVKVRIAPICIEHQIYKDFSFEWMEDKDNMGHEGVGEICEVAAGSRFNVGDRVIIRSPYWSVAASLSELGEPATVYAIEVVAPGASEGSQ